MAEFIVVGQKKQRRMEGKTNRGESTIYLLTNYDKSEKENLKTNE
jgi:hypothetical protein